METITRCTHHPVHTALQTYPPWALSVHTALQTPTHPTAVHTTLLTPPRLCVHTALLTLPKLCVHTALHNLQALVCSILPSTTAITGYATGL